MLYAPSCRLSVGPRKLVSRYCLQIAPVSGLRVCEWAGTLAPAHSLQEEMRSGRLPPGLRCLLPVTRVTAGLWTSRQPFTAKLTLAACCWEMDCECQQQNQQRLC